MPSRRVYETAVEYGLCPVPVEPATKKPFVSWRHLQKSAPTQEEIDRWVAAYPESWVGFVCGEGSGNLEVLDFDIPGKGSDGAPKLPPAYAPWKDLLVENGHGDLLDRLNVSVQTQSGGFHVYYRREGGAKPNTKLAATAGHDVLIETRGKGGFVVSPPSAGYRKLSGSFAAIPVLTSEEAEVLWTAARALDQTPPEEDHRYTTERAAMNGSGSPLDDFNARGSWAEALRGWDFTGKKWEGRDVVKRPGTKNDCSAVIGAFELGERCLVFTTSTPLPANKALTKAACYAYLEHGGDFRAATKALAKLGYGAPMEKKSRERIVREIEEIHPGDGAPWIQINNRQLSDVTNDALDALARSNTPPTMFARDRALVRLNVDDKGDLYVREFDKHSMRESLGRAAIWFKKSDKAEAECFPPVEVAENLLALQSIPRGFPVLSGLSKAPIMRQDGTIFTGPGYDRDSGWMVASTEQWPAFDGTGPEAARWVLDELFGDFPFVDASSKANALGLFLLPFVRTAIDGPTPLFFGDAPRSRSGKTKMLQCALIAGVGEVCDTVAVPDKEEELEKRLHTYITEGRQVIFFDNLRHELKSASLEAALTARVWRGRTLGVSQSSGAPVKAVFCLTANNGKMSIDLAGRAVWIRIDPKMEDPAEREGFKHPDLEGWAVANRPRLVAAAIAMARHWVSEGMPAGAKVKAGFTAFSRVIGGILASCGVDGFLANDKALKSAVNDEEDMWTPFYQEWYELHGWNPATTNSLAKMAIEKELLGDVYANAKSDRGAHNLIGKALKARVDVVFHGVAIRSLPTKLHGSAQLKLEPAGESKLSPFTQPDASLGSNGDGRVNGVNGGGVTQVKNSDSLFSEKKGDTYNTPHAYPAPPVHDSPHSPAGSNRGESPFTQGSELPRRGEDLTDEEILAKMRQLPDGSYVWIEGEDD